MSALRNSSTAVKRLAASEAQAEVQGTESNSASVRLTCSSAASLANSGVVGPGVIGRDWTRYESEDHWEIESRCCSFSLQKYLFNPCKNMVSLTKLGIFTKIADDLGIRVCVYGCSLMDGIKKGADDETDDTKKLGDYQKVADAMRSGDLRILGSLSTSPILYGIYSHSDAGVVHMFRLPDIEHELFWMDKKLTNDQGTVSEKLCCSLCAWAYPIRFPNGATFDFEARSRHIETVSHQRALNCAVLFHALHSFGELQKEFSARHSKKMEKKPAKDFRFQFLFSDIIFWYLHHDRVWHECKAEKVVSEVLRIYRNAEDPSHKTLSELRVLILMCEELKLNRQISQDLVRRNKDFHEQKKDYDIDLGRECLFKMNFFDLFHEAEHDSSIKFLVEAMNECDKIQTLCRSGDASNANSKTTSFPTKQWILHTAGQSMKLHGHGVRHIYETCEVEKTSNIFERWRHMIFSYAVCSLLWNEFNGNKEGPIGFYPQRRNQCLGSVHKHNQVAAFDAQDQGAPEEFKLGDLAKLRQRARGQNSQIGDHEIGEICEIFDTSAGNNDYCRIRFGEYTYFCQKTDLQKIGPGQLEYIYASKENGTPLNYVGHNVVAFAVGKRGDILRVAYNHNVLFTSTVDHAEERLIDSLYRDPAAFVQKSHSEILDDKETIDVEKHMQHISVYTSLEPCQQCSGKMHVALVPEVVFCQRDWEIQLMANEMYEKFRKTRSVPASHFNFPPYEQLATSYYEFQRLIDEEKPAFFQSFRPGLEGAAPKTELVAKKTMPYFLCTDDCQDVFCRGDYAFRELLEQLFCSSSKSIIELALDKLVIFHGLNEQFRLDWYRDPNQGFNPDHIRNFRPTLNYKRQRILHDELVAKRHQWIQLRHKLSCSVTITFSSRWRDENGKSVSESMVDMYLSPLADIVSVYIPRELNGLLKGTFKVICVDRASADVLYDLLSTAYNDPSKISISAATRNLQEAVQWLRDIQKTELPTNKVRIDVQDLPRDHPVPAFALTAHTDVIDTKIRKYFDHLCSFSFGNVMNSSRPQMRAPLSLRILNSPWQTCLNRMWLNLDGRDKQFALTKRRLWTVEFPDSPQDVKNLYEAVDFTPDHIIDDYRQPYTQPIFDHTWFCACDESFHNSKLGMGSRIVVTDVIHTHSLFCKMIAFPIHEQDLAALIKDINEKLESPIGHHILSGYSAHQQQAFGLKSGATGVLLFSGRRLRSENEDFFPVRLDSDHSVHFLSSKCLKRIGSPYVRIYWQPPELPLNLFDAERDDPFCFLKIHPKLSKYLRKPGNKDLKFEEHDQDEFFNCCRAIFLPPAETEKSPTKFAGGGDCSSTPQSAKTEKSKPQGVAAGAAADESNGFPSSCPNTPSDRLHSAILSETSDNDSSFEVVGRRSVCCDHVLLHDLDDSVTESELQGVFSSFGTVKFVDLHVLPPCQARYAYVYFSSYHEAETAVRGAEGCSIRGKRLGIMKMLDSGTMPMTEDCASKDALKRWKFERQLDSLKKQIESLNTIGLRGNKPPFSFLKGLKELCGPSSAPSSFDKIFAKFDKFQRLLRNFGQFFDLDIQIDACSKSSLFMTVSDASERSPVTSEMYALFQNDFEGGIKQKTHFFCGHEEKGKKVQQNESQFNPKGKQFQISDKSLATILASDMLRTPKGRRQVHLLLKRAQDDPEKTQNTKDWWNETVKVGKGVDLEKLISFLSDDFVRSSFNFSVCLVDESNATGTTFKVEEVNWLDNSIPVTEPQLLQYALEYCISRKKDISLLLLDDVKRKLRESRLPQASSGQNVQSPASGRILSQDDPLTAYSAQNVSNSIGQVVDGFQPFAETWSNSRYDGNFILQSTPFRFRSILSSQGEFASLSEQQRTDILSYLSTCIRVQSERFPDSVDADLLSLWIPVNTNQGHRGGNPSIPPHGNGVIPPPPFLSTEQFQTELSRICNIPRHAFAAFARERETHECLSSVCMHCQCACNFSSRFQGPIQNLLLVSKIDKKSFDKQNNLFKHLRYYLIPALEGINVMSNCSKILSVVKSFPQYFKTTIADLLRVIDQRENGDSVASSGSAMSCWDGVGDSAASSDAPFARGLSSESPKRFNDHVRRFLTAFDVYELERHLQEPERHFGFRVPNNSVVSTHASEHDYLKFDDFKGFLVRQEIEVIDAERLDECVSACETAINIAFQVRDRYDSKSCCLLQLCCKSNDDYHQVLVVHLPFVINCRKMKDLIRTLCNRQLLCFSDSSERMFRFLSASFDEQPSRLRVLQKELSEKISFRDLIRGTFRRTWNETWKDSGWDVLPLHPDQKKYMELEVLATSRVFYLFDLGTLSLQSDSTKTKRNRKSEVPKSEVPKSEVPKSEFRYKWCRIQSCCSEDPKELTNEKLGISRPKLAPNLTTRNEDPIKEPNASNMLLKIYELERQLLLELSTPRLNFTHERHVGVSNKSEAAPFPAAAAAGGGGVPKSSPVPLLQRNISDSDESFGLQLIIRRQRYDSSPSVAEQQDCFNSGKSYVRFCIDGPLTQLNGLKIEFQMKLPSGQVQGSAMKPKMNPERLDIVEYTFEKKKKEKGYGRVYGCIPEIDNHNLQLLFEPEYYVSSADAMACPFLEVSLEVGAKILTAQVRSFHFKEIVDSSVLKCIELHKNPNRLLLQSNIDERKSICETLENELKNQRNGTSMPLQAWGLHGQSTARCVLEKFKFFAHHDMDMITYSIVSLLCDQGKLLERSCQFYFALKYYFAGLQYFLKLEQAQVRKPLSEEMKKLKMRFVSLFENLLPLTNRQVYEQARSTVEYQRGVMRRGTMMK